MVTTDKRKDFLRWYQPHHDKLVRYCSSRAFGVMDTQDLVQEAVLATLANWDRIQRRDRLLGYMIGVVNNLLRNHKRRAPFRGDWEEERLLQLESRLGDPDTALDIHFLLKHIEQLPTAQAEALQLFHVSGFSIKEIAAIQKTSEGAVKTRLSRARKQLREWMSEGQPGMPLLKRLQVYTSILL